MFKEQMKIIFMPHFKISSRVMRAEIQNFTKNSKILKSLSGKVLNSIYENVNNFGSKTGSCMIFSDSVFSENALSNYTKINS